MYYNASVCALQEILQFSKDYKQMGIEKALDDFHHKIEHYRAQYETIHPKIEAHYSYIKLVNAGTCLMKCRILNYS